MKLCSWHAGLVRGRGAASVFLKKKENFMHSTAKFGASSPFAAHSPQHGGRNMSPLGFLSPLVSHIVVYGDLISKSSSFAHSICCSCRRLVSFVAKSRYSCKWLLYDYSDCKFNFIFDLIDAKSNLIKEN